MKKKSDAAKGNRTKGPRQGRPKKAEGTHRVTLSTSISPESRAILDRMGGSDGVTIDTALAILDRQCAELAARAETSQRVKAALSAITILP